MSTSTSMWPSHLLSDGCPRVIKVATVTTNGIPLDWAGNLQRHLAGLAEARANGASIVLFEELGLTNYGCKTAFHFRWARRKAFERLLEFAESTTGMIAVVGLPLEFGNGVFNALAVCVDGKVVYFDGKTNLAGGAGVHDEPKYFTQYDPEHHGSLNEVRVFGQRYPFGKALLDIGGLRVLIVNCQEFWNADDPAHAAAGMGVDLVLVANASCHKIGKHYSFRRPMVRETSLRLSTAVVYGNSSGWNGSNVVYDGGGFAYDRGLMRAAFPRYTHRDVGVYFATFDIDAARSNRRSDPSFHTVQGNGRPVIEVPFNFPPATLEPVADLRGPWDSEDNPNLGAEEFIRAGAVMAFDMARKPRLNGVFVPFSGGADSTLTVKILTTMPRLVVQSGGWKLLRAAFSYAPWMKQLRKDHVPFRDGQDGPFQQEVEEAAFKAFCLACLHTAYMTANGSQNESLASATGFANQHGISFKVIDIRPLCDALQVILEEWRGAPFDMNDPHDRNTVGNFAPRERAVVTWGRSNDLGLFVVSCGNPSEGQVGYASFHAADDAGVAGYLTLVKSELERILEILYRTGLHGIAADPALKPVVEELEPAAELPGAPGAKPMTDADELGPYVFRDYAHRLLWGELEAPAEILDRMVTKFPEADLAELYRCLQTVLGRFGKNVWKLWKQPQLLYHNDDALSLHEQRKFPTHFSGFAEELEEIRARYEYLQRNADELKALRQRSLSG